MRIGIDASNLRSGGGLTHLSALLAHADAHEAGIEQIVVWGSRATLDRLAPQPWLVKTVCPELDGSATARISWRRRSLPALARAECDILFAPGGLCTNRFHPVVTMSRNMLPFQWREMARYGPSKMLARLALLRFLQTRSLRTADGVLFLSQFAENAVSGATGPLAAKTAVIPHGVAERFFKAPRPQHGLSDYSAARPMRLLYTSIVDVYKHQWQVAEAVAQLRREGLPIAIEFVGDSYPQAGERLMRALRRRDPQGKSLTLVGPVDHAALPDRYHAADAFVFASSCENLPNILLEAMASGLPIACSSRGPMPEVLGTGGLYFDPLKPTEIADALRQLVTDAAVRSRLATEAYDRARHFSWTSCAQATFRFLRDVLDFHRDRSALPALRAMPTALGGHVPSSAESSTPTQSRGHGTHQFLDA
jgi:glycosyltransferase involved in cell wall biosynthesis